MTAVKKLLNYITPSLTNKLLNFFSLVFIEAMKQEKQQIKDAYNQGFRDASLITLHRTERIEDTQEAENYYNETFKNES